MQPYQQRGFTLIEIMVVMVILGILAALIVPKIMNRPEQARLVKVRHDLLTIRSSLDLYKLDNGFYPSTDQGLQALVNKPVKPPQPPAWKSDGYLEEVPLDPWDQPYQYINEEDKIKIYSFGPQGKASKAIISLMNFNATSQ